MKNKSLTGIRDSPGAEEDPKRARSSVTKQFLILEIKIRGSAGRTQKKAGKKNITKKCLEMM